jgi:hypothetical protein
LVLFWFGRDVFWRLGRRRFWRLILVTAAVAAAVAVATHALMLLAGGGSAAPFITMQGHRILITILVAAFATLYGEATILLFFVLPVRPAGSCGSRLLPRVRLPHKDSRASSASAPRCAGSPPSMGGPRRAPTCASGQRISSRLARLAWRRRFEVVDGGRRDHPLRVQGTPQYVKGGCR